MNDSKKNKAETVEEILKNTFDELIQTSGLPEAYLAGELFGFAVTRICVKTGILSCISMLTSTAAKLSEALYMVTLQGKEEDHG